MPTKKVLPQKPRKAKKTAQDVFAENNSPFLSVDAVQDTTECRQAEDAPRDTWRLLETIFNHTHVLMAYLDAQFNFIRVNQAYAAANQQEPEFFPGRNYFDLYPNTENEACFRQTAATGKSYIIHARSLFAGADRPKRGASFFDGTLCPIKNPEGTVTGLALTLTDITERKQADDEFKKSQERYKKLVENSPDIIYSFSNQQGGCYYSARAETILGYTTTYLKEHPFLWHDSIHPDDLEKVDRAIAAKDEVSSYQIEYRIKDANGNWHWLLDRFIEKVTKGDEIIIDGLATDITERKQAEETLRQSEQRLALHFQHAPLGVIEWDAGFKVTKWNPTAEKIFGYAAGEAFGRHAAELIVPTSARAQVDQVWCNLLTKHGGEHSTNENFTKDGRMILCEWHNTPLVTTEGRVIGVASLVEDITERKRAQEKLAESETRYRTIFETVDDVIYETDYHGILTTISPSVWNYINLPPEDLIGRHISELFVDQKDYETLSVEMAAKGWIQDYEIRVRGGDGQERVGSFNAQTIFNEQGQPIATRGVGRDITIRKEMQKRQERFAAELENKVSERTAELKAANTLLKNEIAERKLAEATLDETLRTANDILQSIPSGMFIYQYAEPDKLYLISGNPAAETLTGLKVADWVGMEYNEIWPEAEAHKMKAPYLEVMRTGRNFETEDLRYKDDKINASFRIRAFRLPNNRLAVSCENITERKRAEAERRAVEQKAVESQRLNSLGLMAGGVAHDVNNLLTPIINNIGLLRMEHTALLGIHESLQTVESAARQIRNLVRQMLAYVGREQLAVARIELNALIGESQRLWHASLPKNIAVQLNLSPAPLTVDADRSQLQQVVINLVINAAESFDGKSGQIFISTCCQPSPTGESRNMAVLVVHDTGSGITPENLPRIFDPFFTTKPTGRGLGLSAAQGIIRAHHGKLEVQSTLGKGTTFTIQLPLVAATPAAASPSTSMSTSSVTVSLQGVWLVIDDEDIVRTTTCMVLKRLGLQTLEATDGATGLALIRQNARELAGVLLDLTMPGMNGREVFQQLRDAYPVLPVVFQSGYSEHEVEDLLALPKVGFLPKPYDPNDLQRIIRQVLE